MAKTDLTIEREFYKTIMHDCNVVFDVGCRDDNVFYEVKPSLEIHLFDPNDVSPIEDLKTKFNIHFNNYAIGNIEGEIDFHYRYGSIIHRTEEPKFDGIHQSKKVRISTLKKYCQDRGIVSIDFLKIDTEGYDFEVIKGCGEELLANVKYLQFESWEDGRIGGETDEDIFDFFKGYNIYKLNTSPVNFIVTKESLKFNQLDVVRYAMGYIW